VQTNDEVAALLTEYADLTSITGGDRFRIRTYERAARSVAGYPVDLATLDEKGLREIPNVGASLAGKIEEYLRTGAIGQLEELRAKVPAGVPGLGPKRAMALYNDLGIDSVDGLAAAIRDGKLADLAGFGAKSEENLLRGIELLEKAQGRVTLDVATDLAEDLIQRLSVVTGCERCTYAGSLRRMKDTIGDIDILAISGQPSALMDAVKELPHVTRAPGGPAGRAPG
jgi:DNA polymerase (family X)